MSDKDPKPQKTPVHSVVLVICDILTPLSDEERTRALDAVRSSLGMSATSLVPARTRDLDRERWAENNRNIELAGLAVDVPAERPRWRPPRQNVSWTVQRPNPTFPTSATFETPSARPSNGRRLPMVVVSPRR